MFRYWLRYPRHHEHCGCQRQSLSSFALGHARARRLFPSTRKYRGRSGKCSGRNINSLQCRHDRTNGDIRPTRFFNSVGTIAIDTTFSDLVIGAGEPCNYTLHGSGSGSLQVDSVTELSSTEYRIFFTGSLSNGTFSLAMHNITDELGNPLADDTIQFTADTNGPQATGFTPADGAGVVPINSIPGISFNENIDCSTVNADSLYGDHGLTGTIACSGSTATIVPRHSCFPAQHIRSLQQAMLLTFTEIQRLPHGHGPLRHHGPGNMARQLLICTFLLIRTWRVTSTASDVRLEQWTARRCMEEMI